MVARFVAVSVAVLAVSLLSPAVAAADPPLIKPGEKFEGELAGKKQHARDLLVAEAKWTVNLGRSFPLLYGYGTALGVKLKAGQGVAIAVQTPGAGREVVVMLLDPAKQIIGETTLETRTAS